MHARVSRHAYGRGVDLAPAVIPWYHDNARDLPWRRPRFTPWGTLVSEFMLQQTPVARVVPRLEQWLERWPTPSALASAPAGEAVRAWDRLGYPKRALNLHACAVAIVEHHEGEVPSDVDALLALPGIGPYTARAVAAFAFGLRHPVVDTNVRRVIARAIDGDGEAGAASTKRDLAAMEALLPVSEPDARLMNAAVMELGAIVCTARAPHCGDCPLAAQCAWRSAGYPKFEGKRASMQKKFEGSDRQARGVVLRELRASDVAVSEAELEMVATDAAQRVRAIAGLLADGLIEAVDDGYVLPQ